MKRKRGGQEKEVKMVPLPLKVPPEMIDELENIAVQTDSKRGTVAKEAMTLGIELIYKSGEVRPLKKQK